MEINFNGINKQVQLDKKNNKTKKLSDIKNENKPVEASSLEAQGQYGKAMVNMSFKGREGFEDYEDFNGYGGDCDNDLDSDFDYDCKTDYKPTYHDELQDRKEAILEFLYQNSKATDKLDASNIIVKSDEEIIALAEKLCFDEELNFPKNSVKYVLNGIANHNPDIILDIEAIEDLCTNEKYTYAREAIAKAISNTKATSEFTIKQICDDREKAGFSKEDTCKIIGCLNHENSSLINKIYRSEFSSDEICSILRSCDDINKANNILDDYSKRNFPKNAIPLLMEKQISIEEINNLQQIMDKEELAGLNKNDLFIFSKFVSLYEKQSIGEISASKKRELIRNLVAPNCSLFSFNNKALPLIPKNQEEYYTLLSNLVKSLGIEMKPLSDSKIQEFNNSMNALSSALKELSDIEFNNLKIEQEYDKNDFIKDVLNLTKDMPMTEIQKIYDYFGFELHKNQNNPTGFSISGYPVNLNNSQKLEGIKNPKTKEAIEKLRPFVIKFSENNKVHCNNKEIEGELNKIVECFPEFRTQIGRIQHNTHSFDVFKHSLKVMQKIVQNPEFNNLDDSDKKIMLFAALSHDIGKLEGKSGSKHAVEGAFDTFFISNKLNLTHDEKIKLYSLIQNHEWLGSFEKVKKQAEYDARQICSTGWETPERLAAQLTENYMEKAEQSVAFDMQYDNLFDIAKIFTEADLKAVKNNNAFFDKHKNQLEKCSTDIKKYIHELKKSQPLLPVTQIPKASTVDKAITRVNNDYSTNIKGVYKDENGLIIIKFNEVEDWEKIGFPKGSASKGIIAQGVNGLRETIDVETGNIKFIAHGLTTEDQLGRFDAFALPDSDAMLSVSYTERPESKYRFFRTQGVLLKTDTKYMLGGGNTDSGSGCGKNIDNFKENYIFGGYREEERRYISNLIKDALNLDDEEYIKFVKENANKSMIEIEPAEIREKLIKVLASINSNARKGNREYNEMYITNPEVMGVFAYSEDDSIDNIKEFMEKTNHNNNTNMYKQAGNAFLRQYALENDMPFIIFGD